MLLLQRLPAHVRASAGHGFHLCQFWGREAVLSVEPSYHPSCGDTGADVSVSAGGVPLTSEVQPGLRGFRLRTKNRPRLTRPHTEASLL